MTVSELSIRTPGSPHRVTRGTSVDAFIRRAILGRKYTMVGETFSNPIPRRGSDRVTFYVEGVSGESFGLQLAVNPVFDFAGSSDPDIAPLDASATTWTTLATSTIAAGETIAAQTMEDVALFFRIERLAGAGTFNVYSWWLD